MNRPAIILAGRARKRALASADRELDRIVGELERARADDEANVLEVARITGVARSTLYRRLYERRNIVPDDSTAPAVAPADPDLPEDHVDNDGYPIHDA